VIVCQAIGLHQCNFYQMNNASYPDPSAVDIEVNQQALATATPHTTLDQTNRVTPVWIWVTAGCLTVLVALAFWFAWTKISKPQVVASGTPSSVAMRGEGNGQTGINDPDQVNAMIQRLTERLKNSPSDVEGWSMLARTQSVVGHTNEAVDAYAKAVALSKDDAGLLVDYADALAVKNNHSLAGEPYRLIERALKSDPRNVKAVALAGSYAFDNKDYVAAVKYWDKVIEIAGADNMFAQRTRFQLAQARQLSSPVAALVPASSVNSVAGNGSAIKVAPESVGSLSGLATLAPSLSGTAKPEDAVFIFARNAQGSRMPLAILRKQVKDLPIRFTLNFGMGNGTTAADGGVQLVARISKSGNAVAAKGDLSGTSEVVKINAKDVPIEINQVINQ
jgi:cytochrome c-type biogenesis protein CcmH